MSQKIKKINLLKGRIKELSEAILKKDSEIFKKPIEEVIPEDIKLPKKKGKRGRPKVNK